MLVRNPYYFERSILDIDKYTCDFFRVKVILPKDIKNQILQYKINKKEDLSTIYLLRNWIEIYFSEDIINAKWYNYCFKVINGYHKKKDIYWINILMTLIKLS